MRDEKGSYRQVGYVRDGKAYEITGAYIGKYQESLTLAEGDKVVVLHKQLVCDAAVVKIEQRHLTLVLIAPTDGGYRYLTPEERPVMRLTDFVEIEYGDSGKVPARVDKLMIQGAFRVALQRTN